MSAPFDPTAPPVDDGTDRPTRPDALAIATELWIVVILTQIVAFFGQYPTLRKTWDEQVATMPKDTQTQREQVEMMSSGVLLIVVMVVACVILTAISVTAVIFARNGYNPARLILAAMGFFVAFNLLFALFGSMDPAWVMIPMIISGVAAGGASVLLLRREPDEYCRDMAAFRRAARRPAWPVRGVGAPPQNWPPPSSGYSPGSGPGWPYGDGQQPTPPPPVQPTDDPQRNEGNDSR